MSLSVIILAAGRGKRMLSNTPKILHPLGGTPLLEHVVKTAERLSPSKIQVVYGNGGSTVRETLDYLPVEWIQQKEQLGTGHAVLQAMPACDDNDQVLVLYGDVPLITQHSLQQLLDETPPNGLGLIVTEPEDPTGFGRIIRNEMGNIIAIVEEKDATEQQRKIQEINTGIITTSARFLKSCLPELKNNNKQTEYYLTDIVALAVAAGHPVGGVMAHHPEEVRGVNDRWQLAKLERDYQLMMAKQLAYAGVTIMDPSRLDIRGKVETGKDVVLDVNVVIEGEVSIGSNTNIGPNVTIKNATIGDNVVVHANTLIEGAKIADNAVVGPFARLRPGSVLERETKVGNFVEMKNTVLGAGSKASHLSYLGDAVIGKQVNIGAGTITCNYDGVNKWETAIEDGAFIGSNTSLIAPVKVGKQATIAAGSQVSKDAPADRLTIARAKQSVVKGWQRPVSTSKSC